jgi:hypothetical protein
MNYMYVAAWCYNKSRRIGFTLLMLKHHSFDRDASRAFVSGNFTGKSASYC